MTRPLPANSLVRGRQRGVSIVTAIFLLVVLGGIGTALLTTFTGQQVSSGLDLQGTRAYQAARAGVEFGLFQRTQNGVCAGATSFVPAASTLAAFTVTVNCTVTPTANMPAALNQVRITATACNMPAGGACPNGNATSIDYVQRVVTVEF